MRWNVGGALVRMSKRWAFEFFLFVNEDGGPFKLAADEAT